jgi:hypothetical protein
VSTINSAVWRVKLQVNLLETLFSARWETVRETGEQIALRLHEEMDPAPLRVRYRQAIGPTLVVRVAMTFTWYAPDGTERESELVLSPYVMGDSGPVRAEGCHTHT